MALRGDSEVSFAYAVSGIEGMTMMVMLGSGTEAQLCAPMMVFKNKDRNYPIGGVPDDVTVVWYRTQPKGWMDFIVFK